MPTLVEICVTNVCDGVLFLKVARASRSGFEKNPDRDGLATVWTPAAALRALDPGKSQRAGRLPLNVALAPF
jgi:hypothetical protein